MDIVYRRTFKLDLETMQRGLNFTLTTSLGDIGLLGKIAGGGNYNNLIVEAVTTKPFGVECRRLNLEQLIKSKRAAGRP